MRIAVINEVSCCARNKDIVNALQNRGHEIINLGMKNEEGEPVLTYMETGFLTGVVLNLGAADLVIGGCGTGIGYANAVMQYPGVVCGLMETPLDAWMFIQINAGNCISLPLNKGYGWGSDEKLIEIFDQLLRMDLWEHGYPEHRRESEIETRKQLMCVSLANHYDFETLLDRMNVAEPTIIPKSFHFPGISDFISNVPCTNKSLQRLLVTKYLTH